MVSTEIPGLTVWNTWSIRSLRGREGLAGKNLQIVVVAAGRRDVGLLREQVCMFSREYERFLWRLEGKWILFIIEK